MPYIKKSDRPELDENINKLNAAINCDGQLNYTITRLLLGYIKNKGKKYTNFNCVMGVLNCVTHEFYRRFVAPYEDEKIKENGDVE